jgi:dihydroflavonol-4-reductase
MITVVTGATGHVGANLVRALIERGRTVRALTRSINKSIQDCNMDIVKGNVCDIESLYEAFKDADVVYHLAAHISLKMNELQSVYSTNVDGTKNVVEACLRCGVRRLVHFSSIHAHCQEPLNMPINELRPLVTSHCYPHYDRSKAEGEGEVRKGIERGLDAVIVNPTGIIGPYDYEPSHFGKVIILLATGKLPAIVNSGFDWVDVRDVVEGAIKAEEKATNGAKYLLSGHWVSIRDLADKVEEITGVYAPRFTMPMWLAQIGTPFITGFAHVSRKKPLYTSVALKALQGNRKISHEAATSELGYSTRPFQVTLEDTLRWFKENDYY